MFLPYLSSLTLLKEQRNAAWPQTRRTQHRHQHRTRLRV